MNSSRWASFKLVARGLLQFVDQFSLALIRFNFKVKQSSTIVCNWNIHCHRVSRFERKSEPSDWNRKANLLKLKCHKNIFLWSKFFFYSNSIQKTKKKIFFFFFIIFSVSHWHYETSTTSANNKARCIRWRNVTCHKVPDIYWKAVKQNIGPIRLDSRHISVFTKLYCFSKLENYTPEHVKVSDSRYFCALPRE